MGKVGSGPSTPNWRGGRITDPRGYVLLRVGKDHPLADVRIIAAAAGNDVDGKHVHHDDENKGNNTVENLEPLTASEHRRRHRGEHSRLRIPGEENPTVNCACGCGATFPRFDGLGRPREWVSGHNPRPTPNEDSIRAAIAAEPQRLCDIAAKTGITKHLVSAILSRMRKTGAAHQHSHGVWASGPKEAA